MEKEIFFLSRTQEISVINDTIAAKHIVPKGINYTVSRKEGILYDKINENKFILLILTTGKGANRKITVLFFTEIYAPMRIFFFLYVYHNLFKIWNKLTTITVTNNNFHNLDNKTTYLKLSNTECLFDK